MHVARIALLLALVVAPAAVRAGDPPVAINCLDAVGTPGGVASVEVVLIRDGEALVAATQNDLQFDSSRFTIERGDCFINPAIGPGTEADKDISQSVLSDPALVRAIIISLDSINVIPQGLLYTCPFRVNADTPLGSYPLTNGNVFASNTDGMSVPASPGSCQIVVAEPTPTTTPTPRCRENEDCPSGQICVDGECVTPTPTRTPTGCMDNEDCPPGQVCSNNTCVTPTPTPTGRCDDNEDCPPGQVCLNNMCVTATPTPRCRENEDCPSGEVCVDGECLTATPTVSPSVTPTATPGGGGGGDGCNCQIDPGAGAPAAPSALAVVLPALMLFLRWRTRRAAR